MLGSWAFLGMRLVFPGSYYFQRDNIPRPTLSTLERGICIHSIVALQLNLRPVTGQPVP